MYVIYILIGSAEIDLLNSQWIDKLNKENATLFASESKPELNPVSSFQKKRKILKEI